MTSTPIKSSADKPQLHHSSHDDGPVSGPDKPHSTRSSHSVAAEVEQHEVAVPLADNYLNYVVDDGLRHVFVAETLASALLNSDLFCVDFTETCGTLLDVSSVVTPQLGMIQANDCVQNVRLFTNAFS